MTYPQMVKLFRRGRDKDAELRKLCQISGITLAEGMLLMVRSGDPPIGVKLSMEEAAVVERTFEYEMDRLDHLIMYSAPGSRKKLEEEYANIADAIKRFGEFL